MDGVNGKTPSSGCKRAFPCLNMSPKTSAGSRKLPRANSRWWGGPARVQGASASPIRRPCCRFLGRRPWPISVILNWATLRVFRQPLSFSFAPCIAAPERRFFLDISFNHLLLFSVVRRDGRTFEGFTADARPSTILFLPWRSILVYALGLRRPG